MLNKLVVSLRDGLTDRRDRFVAILKKFPDEPFCPGMRMRHLMWSIAGMWALLGVLHLGMAIRDWIN